MTQNYCHSCGRSTTFITRTICDECTTPPGELLVKHIALRAAIIIFIFFSIMLFSHVAKGQTIADGAIISDTHFEAQVLSDLSTDTCPIWLDWDYWEHQQAYSVKVQPGDTLYLQFIRWAGAPCADTTHVAIAGQLQRSKHYQSITLNGSKLIVN